MKITNAFKVALKSLLSIRMGKVETDKAVLVWDGEEDLKEGIEVFVINQDDEAIPAEDGEYVTADGKTIVVVDGKVSEIRDPEAEVAPEDAPEIENIQEEEEPAPADDAVEEPAEERTIEDRVAEVEERVAAFAEGINQIVNALAAIEERLGEVEGKLASVEAPQADPIDEQPKVEERKSMLSYLRK